MTALTVADRPTRLSPRIPELPESQRNCRIWPATLSLIWCRTGHSRRCWIQSYWRQTHSDPPDLQCRLRLPLALHRTTREMRTDGRLDRPSGPVPYCGAGLFYSPWLRPRGARCAAPARAVMGQFESKSETSSCIVHKVICNPGLHRWGLQFPLTFELSLGLARFLGSVRDGILDFLYWQRPTSTATVCSASGTGKVSKNTQTVAVLLRCAVALQENG